jgi:serine/threonine protein kinase
MKVGTTMYRAPETYKPLPPNSKALYEGRAIDLFACGVVLFALVMGHFPFGKATE